MDESIPVGGLRWFGGPRDAGTPQVPNGATSHIRSNEERASARTAHPVATSIFVVSRDRIDGLPRQVHLFSSRLFQDGQPVLNTQALDHPVTQVAAEANEIPTKQDAADNAPRLPLMVAPWSARWLRLRAARLCLFRR